MAAELTITAFKRVPFKDDIVIVGPDYSEATFLMEVRPQPGSSGAALVSLTDAPAGSQGISAVFDPAFEFELNGVLTIAPASILTVQINETTLEGLSYGSPTEDAVTLAYDIHASAVGMGKHIPFFGKFLIKPGVAR